MQSTTLSITLGKGSISHNTRAFVAENVDPIRTPLNVVFTNQDIKQTYHYLFDEALEKYNAKQKRSDRVIKDYYEKIRTGKQEKLFHEIVVQIGNKDTMNATSENGQLAKAMLIEYMNEFLKRNQNLYVFSAHLHMDEETPHLHIDFVPYITGSKRGLETRVSLKKAMEELGFIGKGKQETEYNLWVNAEKEHLARIMQEHGIEWQKLGTHNQHLSVYEFKKQERIKEVEELNKQVDSLVDKIKDYQQDIHDVDQLTSEITDDLWNIPEPRRFMSAHSYKKDIIEPFIKKLKTVIKRIINDYLRLRHEVKELRTRILPLRIKINEQDELIDRLLEENRTNSTKLKKLQRVLGQKAFEEIINKPKEKSKNVKQKDCR